MCFHGISQLLLLHLKLVGLRLFLHVPFVKSKKLLKFYGFLIRTIIIIDYIIY